jgi:hypothetical protein
MVPGNQEVQTLPEMVSNWIHKTHGETAAERAAADTALFVILTKFDQRFGESKGDDQTSEARWTTSITTALTDFYGKSRDNWPAEWKPGKAFDNCFWLRNPNFTDRGLIEYSDDNAHTEVGVHKPERIARFKQEYLGNEMVRKHFSEPEKAWNAAFSLNDGGITFLAQALAPICKPELKRNQISARLSKLSSDLIAKLAEFRVSRDRAEEDRKRVEAAQNAVLSLLDVAECDRFGHLLREMQVSGDDVQLLFDRTKLAGDKRPADGPRIKRKTIMDRLGLKPADAGGNAGTAGGSGEQHDRYTDLAAAAMAQWADQLQALLGQSQVLNFLRVDTEAIEIVVRELLAGSERIGLVKNVAREMRETNPAIDETLKPAMASAESINRYVWKLGQDLLDLAQRATVQNEGGKQAVFQSRKPPDGMADLGEDGEAQLEQFVGDWLSSFIELTRMNSLGDMRQRFSAQESSRLNGILQRFGA